MGSAGLAREQCASVHAASVALVALGAAAFVSAALHRGEHPACGGVGNAACFDSYELSRAHNATRAAVADVSAPRAGAALVSAGVALTYGVGGSLSHGAAWRLFQPLKGGERFVMLQTAAWLCFAAVLLAAAAPRAVLGPLSGTMHLAGGTAGLVCEVLMLASVLCFDRTKGAIIIEPRRARRDRRLKLVARAAEARHRRVLSADADEALRTGGRFPRARAVLVAACHLLAVAAAALLVCAARASVVPDPGFRMPVRPWVSAGMAAATMLVALTITHGLVGWLRYRDGWAGFFQPFAGGAHYVLCQILAWTLASVCLCALAAGATTARPHSALMLAAATGLLSEVALAASLVYYTPTHRGELPKPGGARARPQLGLGAALARATRVAIAWSAVCALYSSPYAAMFVFIGPLLVLPPSTSLPLVAVMAATYFPAVLMSTAPSTGAREWPWLQGVIGGCFDAAAECYFDGVHVVRVPDAPLQSGAGADASAALDRGEGMAGARPPAPIGEAPLPDQAIFGFHPHGLLPATAAWLKMTSAWKRAVPASSPPVTLAASPPFAGPILRDLLCWGGVREVSSPSFSRALDEGRSVLLCPGGQTELLMQSARDPGDGSTEMVLDASRQGFLRKAIEAQVPVIPTFVIGERLLIHNLIVVRWLQKLAYRVIGFPIPFVPVGMAGVLPFPRRTRMIALVGDPLYPPPPPADADSLAAAMKVMHTAYYDRLESMYAAHAHLNAQQPLRLVRDKASLEEELR